MKHLILAICAALVFNFQPTPVKAATEMVYALPGWFAVDEQLPPMDVLVRTLWDDDTENSQKAILKADGWYYPSGLKKLPYTPAYWQFL